MTDVLADALVYRLGPEAEAVRWRTEDIPWGDLRPDRASPGLRALVREMAFSEQTTFSATQRFLQAFADDVDLSQWISIWFYEETRHPAVLMRWLAALGEGFDEEFVLRGRVSAPFMRSRMGTLCTNIISEMTAASAYAALAARAPEPLIAGIGRRLAGDEARHAASFFRYAHRQIERSARPLREQLDAVKVLHFWLNDNGQVTHPVNQMLARAKDDQDLADTMAVLSFDRDELRHRVCAVVARLTGVPLAGPAEVASKVAALTAAAHGSASPANGA